MSYAPINIPAYVAAYSGAISGMAVSGWITDPKSADYALVTAIAGAFAQEFDTVWNNAAALNSLEVSAITQIAAEDFSKRGPGPLSSVVFATPSNWSQAAVACAALVLQSDAYFAGQAITPPPTGSGLTSFNGRTAPAAIPTAGDYTSQQVSDASSVGGPTVFASLNTLLGSAGCAKSGTTTSGSFACAENLNTIASGNNSHAEGSAGQSGGNNSHAEGSHGLAQGLNSHVEGDTCGTSVGASASHAEGSGTNCTGVNSHAEGRGGSTFSDGSHVEGVNSSATGLGSHAEGVACTTTGTGAHAEGFQTGANADTAHAEGQGSLANGTSSHAEGYFSVATGNGSHAGGASSRSWLNSDYAHSGGGFSVPGDAQYRAGEPKGQTNGSVPGETTVLVQGVLGEPLSLQNSTCYGITVRATASVQALGAAARQCAYYHLEFLVAVDSAGAVTVSAVTTVVPAILMGASFVGATLVPSGVNRVGATPAQLALTFSIAGGLTVQSHIVAHIEYVEILGT
jgi:hypothetical protein